VRQAAVSSLGNLNNTRIIEPLLPKLNDPAWQVRQAAVGALSGFDTPQVLNSLTPRLKDPSWEVRQTAVATLGSKIDIYPKAKTSLIATLRDNHPQVRLAAINSLSRLNDIETVNSLISLLKDKNPSIRRSAAFSLADKLPKYPRLVKEFANILRYDDNADLHNIAGLGLLSSKLPQAEAAPFAKVEKPALNDIKTPLYNPERVIPGGVIRDTITQRTTVIQYSTKSNKYVDVLVQELRGNKVHLTVGPNIPISEINLKQLKRQGGFPEYVKAFSVIRGPLGIPTGFFHTASIFIEKDLTTNQMMAHIYEVNYDPDQTSIFSVLTTRPVKGYYRTYKLPLNEAMKRFPYMKTETIVPTYVQAAKMNAEALGGIGNVKAKFFDDKLKRYVRKIPFTYDLNCTNCYFVPNTIDTNIGIPLGLRERAPIPSSFWKRIPLQALEPIGAPLRVATTLTSLFRQSAPSIQVLDDPVLYRTPFIPTGNINLLPKKINYTASQLRDPFVPQLPGIPSLGDPTNRLLRPSLRSSPWLSPSEMSKFKPFWERLKYRPPKIEQPKLPRGPGIRPSLPRRP
jgi:hypothetical protein